jgi:hypothetical protein
MVRQRLDRGADHENQAQRQVQDARLVPSPPCGPLQERCYFLILQRWNIEDEWHWVRDTQLGEDAHRYTVRIGALVFAFLRMLVMNLLRCAAYHSIRQGLRDLAYETSKECLH